MFVNLDSYHIENYHFQILADMKLYEGSTLLHDTEDIFDNGPEGLRGGRLGVYCDSQANVRWSALSYRYFYLVQYTIHILLVDL